MLKRSRGTSCFGSSLNISSGQLDLLWLDWKGEHQSLPERAARLTDFPLIEQLKTILADPACAEWMLANVKHGAAPAFISQGILPLATRRAEA